MFPTSGLGTCFCTSLHHKRRGFSFSLFFEKACATDYSVILGTEEGKSLRRKASSEYMSVYLLHLPLPLNFYRSVNQHNRRRLESLKLHQQEYESTDYIGLLPSGPERTYPKTGMLEGSSPIATAAAYGAMTRGLPLTLNPGFNY